MNENFEFMLVDAFTKGFDAGYESHKSETRPEIEVDNTLKIRKLKHLDTLYYFNYYYVDQDYMILEE